jgi:hypothetical protein
MQLAKYLFDYSLATMRNRAAMLTSMAILMTLLFPSFAQGAFVSPYELGNFVLLNTNADGSWTSPDGDETLILTGGNNGSGVEGNTYFLMFAPQTIFVSFHFSWQTEDLFPEFDLGGYLSGGNFHSLTDMATMGNAGFIVPQGQGFGFGVRTLDNWGGAGSLTVTNFQVSDATASTPEPSTVVPLMLVAGCFVWWLRRNSAGQTKRAL